MITRDQVENLLLAACPSFMDSSWWYEYRSLFGEEPEPLNYLLASAFISHLVDLKVEGKTSEFAPVFQLIERMHREGDPYVQELATVGFLEDLQNAHLHRKGSTPEAFLQWLGSESAWWWEELNLFWESKLKGGLGSSGRPKPLPDGNE